MNKLICLDYDGTFTEFPDLMFLIIDYCKKHNIEIILTTMRMESEMDNGLEQIKKEIPVYFTSRKAKKDYLKSLGIYPTIWIDDNPLWIYKDAI